MSNICKSCSQTISWDPEVRKTLGIRGPINPDGSIHRCMGIHKQEQQDAVSEATTTKTMEVTTKSQLTDDEILTLKQFVSLLKLIAK